MFKLPRFRKRLAGAVRSRAATWAAVVVASFLALGVGERLYVAAWAQAPDPATSLGPPAVGILPYNSAGGQNPSSINPSLGSPVAPTNPQRPAGWVGGTASAPAAGNAFAPAFDGSTGTNKKGPRLASSTPAWVQLPPDKMKFEGAELVARVGSEVILAADLLYDINRHIEQIKRTPQGQAMKPEEESAIRLMYMRQYLQRSIDNKLLYAACRRGIPAEAMPKIEKHFNESFDKEYLRNIMDSNGVGSRTELEAKLRKEGASLEWMKRQTFENGMAQRWLEDHIEVNDEITHQQMRDYYNQHAADYERPRRARWEHLAAHNSQFPGKAEAFQAVAAWGNEVMNGADFAEVAKAHSNDPSSSDGGVHPWTTKGSLVSGPIDEAIFSLPVGKLSPIIEDPRGFHIVRVIERDDLTRVPFAEAQVEIKKKIRDERSEDRKRKFIAGIKATTPVWTIFDDLPPLPPIDQSAH